MGLLKRLRLSPLPTWMLLAAIFINSMIIAVIQIVLMLLVGRFGYDVHGPHDIAVVRARHDRRHARASPRSGSGSARWCPTPTRPVRS